MESPSQCVRIPREKSARTAPSSFLLACSQNTPTATGLARTSSWSPITERLVPHPSISGYDDDMMMIIVLMNLVDCMAQGEEQKYHDQGSRAGWEEPQDDCCRCVPYFQGDLSAGLSVVSTHFPEFSNWTVVGVSCRLLVSCMFLGSPMTTHPRTIRRRITDFSWFHWRTSTPRTQLLPLSLFLMAGPPLLERLHLPIPHYPHRPPGLYSVEVCGLATTRSSPRMT